MSLLPGSTAKAFSTRIVYVVMAILYALLMVAPLWSRRSE
jgi:hypothetical protein